MLLYPLLHRGWSPKKVEYLGQKIYAGPSFELRRATVSASLEEKLKGSLSLSSVWHFTKLTRDFMMIFTAGFKPYISLNFCVITDPKLF